jgi:hypothetical protein
MGAFDTLPSHDPEATADLAAHALELHPDDWHLEHVTAHLAAEHPQIAAAGTWPDDNPYTAHDNDHRDWIYGHTHTHDRTGARREAADAAFNQLNPEFDLDVDSHDPERQRAVQGWESYRSLGGRADNHLRIDNTGPAWMRRLLVVHRAVDALRRGAREGAEAAFTALNPDFGVLPDGRDPQQHRFAAGREQALMLGTRAAEALRAHNHPDPQQRQRAVAGVAVQSRLHAAGDDPPTHEEARRVAELTSTRRLPQRRVPERARGGPARSGAER